MFRYLLCCKSNFEGHQMESKKRIRRRVKEERRGDDERDSDEAVEKREGNFRGNQNRAFHISYNYRFSIIFLFA